LETSFLGLQKGRTQPADDGRHFGLVVDDKEAARKALADAGIKTLPGPFLDFLDPWGNRVEIVGYTNVQFTKAPNVLRGMGLTHLSKNATAIKELTDKGMALGPDTAKAFPNVEVNTSVVAASVVAALTTWRFEPVYVDLQTPHLGIEGARGQPEFGGGA